MHGNACSCDVPGIDQLMNKNPVRGMCLRCTNKKQAYIPKDSIKLHNNFGTAPGVIINENKKMNNQNKY